MRLRTLDNAHRRRRGVTERVGLALALLASSAPAAAQTPADPATAAAMYARSQERGADQLANPDYARRFMPLFQSWLLGEDPMLRIETDPYRLDWGCADEDSPAGCEPRGEELEVRFRNRYGASLRGFLHLPLRPFRDPVSGAVSDGPFPALLLLTGGWSNARPYFSLAQGLAEAGYVVFGVEVQGDNFSDVLPPDPDPSTPENEYCRPGNWNNWQEPQEMGIREEGPCAGQSPRTSPEPEDDIDFVAGVITDEPPPYEQIEHTYERMRARKTFGALDAVAWLLSEENPRRALVNPDRIGIAGSSLGAHAALLAGNGDPERRFDAVVAWDGYGRLGQTAAPRVPTMFQHSELSEFGPKRRAPDPDERPGARDSLRFAEERIDTMLITLAGSTHQDWQYIPYRTINIPYSPFCPAFCNASRDGERIALHYTLAWFDRWLKPGQQQRTDARRRLTARNFDASADRSSIGQGGFDAATQANAPYTIDGKNVGEALSPFFRSSYAFDGEECADLRRGCE